MTTLGSGLIARPHCFTRPVVKLLIAFTAETLLHPKQAPSEFAAWLHKQPKLTARTKERYRRHASTLLGVDIPKSDMQSQDINALDESVTAITLTVETYKATIEKLKRINRANDDAAIAKQVALTLFICTAITGYSLADLLTSSSLSTPKTDTQGLSSCELTIHPVRHNKTTSPITHHYSGLNEFEVAQMKALITIAAVHKEHPEFFRKLHKNGFNYITNANPVKQCNLWDMRRIYPKVLGYLQDA